MTNEEKFQLITRRLEETLTEDELKTLIESGRPIRHYIGLEISGKAHVGWVFMMKKIKDLQDSDVEVQILLADWHTWLNKKLDGTLETAKRLARDYFEEALKAAAICAGANPEKIKFVLGSELYDELGTSYWASVIKVMKATTLARMLRSTTIMGRKESEVSDTAMLVYPAMQSADISALKVNLAHAGTDQRNVHIVARESAGALGEEKPIAIHHHLLQGLLQPVLTTDSETGKQVMDMEAAKMSKSKPNSAVFIHDDQDSIKKKINAAYAPEGIVEFNPILDWCKYLIFYTGEESLAVKRDSKWGGDLVYNSYEELERDYAGKKLHPMDLKNAVADWLIEMLQPAKKHFEDPKRKAASEEIEKLTTK